jgi:hypothetical protein
MRGFLKNVLMVGAVAGFLLTAAAAFVAWQSGLAAAVAQPEAEVLTAAELVEIGPGANAHVRLTDFTFGKPVFEVQNDGLRNVWVPVLPNGKVSKTAKTTLFYKPIGLDKQAELAPFLEQTTLDVFVANRLPEESLWRARGKETLWKAHPKIEATAALMLTDSQIQVAGTPLLGPDRACDPDFAKLGWAVAAGLAVTTLLILALALRGNGTRPQDTGKTAADRARLAGEPALSWHRFTFRSVILEPVLPLVGAAACGYAAYWGLPAPVPIFLDGYPLGGVILVVAILLGFAAAVAGPVWVLWRFANRAYFISVCPSGLRFNQGGWRYLRLWSELTAVERKDHQQTVQHQGAPLLLIWSTLTLRFSTGESLRLISDYITDFEELYQQAEQHRHAQLNGAFGARGQNVFRNRGQAPRPPWVTR